MGNLLKATYFGATRIITTKPYAPDLLLQLIEKYKISHLFTSSQHISDVLNHELIDKVDLSSVKSIALSGQKMSLDQYANMKQYFKNAVPYILFGISELGGAISVARGDQLKLSVAGKLVNGTQVKIVDENGKRVGIRERGHICVKSAYHFLGYYGKENLDSIIDHEQFVRTGNIGYFDNSGFLSVLGREVDMIKYQNYLISPKEIEDCLCQNPDIQSVCVVGLKNNTSLAALVVKSPNTAISEAKIIDLVSGNNQFSHIIKLMLPKFLHSFFFSTVDNFEDSHNLCGGVYFVDSLPSTPSGKVIRRLARTIAEKEFGRRNSRLMTTWNPYHNKRIGMLQKSIRLNYISMLFPFVCSYVRYICKPK